MFTGPCRAGSHRGIVSGGLKKPLSHSYLGPSKGAGSSEERNWVFRWCYGNLICQQLLLMIENDRKGVQFLITSPWVYICKGGIPINLVSLFRALKVQGGMNTECDIIRLLGPHTVRWGTMFFHHEYVNCLCWPNPAILGNMSPAKVGSVSRSLGSIPSYICNFGAVNNSRDTPKNKPSLGMLVIINK